MKKIAVIGIGSAGVQSLSHFLHYLDKDWEVYSIYNPDISIVGIGESTNPVFTEAISLGLNFDFAKDLSVLDGSLKFGTRYINWRNHTFVNPLIGGGISIHLNTYKLKNFALERLRSLWGNRFKEIIGDVNNLSDDEEFAYVEVNNIKHSFDYVIDCRGFPKDYDEYNIIKDMPVNDCLVHNIEIDTQDSFKLYYTDSIATKDGWMFKIPLMNKISYGYLFNNNITNLEEAKVNFSELIDVNVKDLQDTRYSFSSYSIKHLINNRIIKNGNRAVFFEPKFSNSLWMYDNINRYAFDYITGVIDQTEANTLFATLCKELEEMIAYHYLGGSTINNDFWNYAMSTSKTKIQNSQKLKSLINIPKEFINDKKYTENLVWIFPMRLLLDLDKNFEYNLFS